MSKATKVPAMRESQPYLDWKKELQIWQVTNAALGVASKIQAGTLFQSLEGVPRQTVLSELTVEEITHEDGVDNIIGTLDSFYIGNETQSAYTAIDELMQYKCGRAVSMENFIIQFQLIVNKVKASGTVLSDGVLGYTLLNSANLSEEKRDMVKATCDVLSFRNVKMQLEKVGFGKLRPNTSKFSTVPQPVTSDVVKLETFYGDRNQGGNYEQQSGNSSDEDLNGEQVLYAENSASVGIRAKGKFKINPSDRFGHPRPCTYCKCLYHWLIECPYAPDSVKNGLRTKSSNYGKTSKPL